jgi:hypothetical protein
MNSVDASQELKFIQEFAKRFGPAIDPFEYINKFDASTLADDSGV